MDMLDCLQELVLDGKSVRMGELGLFSVGITSEGAEMEDQWNVSMLTGVHLNVRNTKAWSNAELRKKCRLSELTAYTKGNTENDASENSGGL